MSEAVPRKDRRYTWADYRSWPRDERWEILDGAAYDMSPSPSLRHQAVARELLVALAAFFRGKECEVLAAPIDLKLSDTDVLGPDLVVVCDAAQLKRTHIEGPPALVVEILSRSTEVRDRHDKMAVYARFGVREYWIVTPFPPLVEVYRLEESGYRVERVFTKGETLKSTGFPGLAVDLSAVFSFTLDPEEEQGEPPAE